MCVCVCPYGVVKSVCFMPKICSLKTICPFHWTEWKRFFTDYIHRLNGESWLLFKANSSIIKWPNACTYPLLLCISFVSYSLVLYWCSSWTSLCSYYFIFLVITKVLNPAKISFRPTTIVFNTFWPAFDILY